MGQRIEISKDDFSVARAMGQAAPEPAAGQAVLRVERFAFSANNLTYARLGDTIGYWRFFPARPGWGCVPVWGIGQVTASRHAEVPVGATTAGLLPMAIHTLVSPGRVTSGGFDEDAAHRRELPRLYNVYRWTTANGRDRDVRMVLQPTFWLSFLLADFLEAHAGFGAEAVLVTSASSKSAIGLGFLLRDKIRTIGLTAPARRDAVDALGAYDRVLSYPDIATLPDVPAVLVDLTGSPAIRATVRDRMTRLRYSLTAGSTHGSAADAAAVMTAPGEEFFFVPDYLRARARDLGMDILAARFDTALGEYARWSAPWLEIREAAGPDAVLAAYRSVLAGDLPISAALVCRLT